MESDRVRDICSCDKTGWLLQLNGEWKECPTHFQGQLHPDTQTLLLDDIKNLEEEERKGHLKWLIKNQRQHIANLSQKLREAQMQLTQMELELINKTATIKLEAVKIPPEAVVEIPIESRKQSGRHRARKDSTK